MRRSIVGRRTKDKMTALTKQQAGLAAVFAVTILAGWQPIVKTFALAFRDDNYTYILLIAPISAAMVFLEWRAIKKVIAPGVVAGATVLATSLLIALSVFCWSQSIAPDIRLSIEMTAIVLSWCGAFLFFFGYRAARSVLFALCLLFVLVPLPKGVMNEIIVLLQHGSAWSANLLFSICGVPVARDGVFITIPGLTLQVAQECSSIRSSSMLLVTTIVMAQLLLRSTWRKALLIGVAIPLSIAKNGLRIFSIAMLGTRVDPVYITGRFHHEGGIIFFAIALVVIFALLAVLRRRDAAPETRESQLVVNRS
jgi:exosortase